MPADPSSTHPTALVLGGVSPHIAVIDRLRVLGYRPVLTDYKHAPPPRPMPRGRVRLGAENPFKLRWQGRIVSQTDVTALSEALPPFVAVFHPRR